MQLLVEKGLNTVLKSDATLSALVGQRVVNSFAKEPVYPYVFFSHNSGGDTNLQRRGQADLMYLIKGMSTENTGGKVLAAQIAEAIYNALHEKPFVIDAGWKVYRVQRTNIVQMVELDGDINYYHHGAMYRIRVSQDI